MGWESSGVVGFDLGPLLEGQMRTAKLESAYNLLIIGPRGFGALSLRWIQFASVFRCARSSFSCSSSSRRYKSSQPAWKKKVFIKPEELTSNEKQICEKKFENSGSSTGEGSRSPVRSDKWRKVKDESGTSKIKQESGKCE